MIRRALTRYHLGISEQRLRSVYGNHKDNDKGRADKKIEPLLFAPYVEDMLFSDDENESNRNGKNELEDEVKISEAGGEMKSSACVREEIRHEVLKEYRCQNRKRKTNVGRYITEKTALVKDSHRQNGVVEIIAPTQNRL